MSPDDKKRRVEKSVAAIQKRFGLKAIRPLGEQPAGAIARVSTAFPQLDLALDGGIPRGRVTEIASVPTSGGATVVLKLIANVQAQDSMAIYLDIDRAFDPDYAARCGVDLSLLRIMRPYSPDQALAIMQDFIAGGGIGILVVDAPFRWLSEPRTAQLLASTLHRIIASLHRGDCILLFLVSLPAQSSPSWAVEQPINATLAHYAAIRIVIHQERWRRTRKGIRGYNADVHILKPVARQVSIAITFNGVVAKRGA